MPKELLFDVRTLENTPALFDRQQILETNPQRYEMVQLDAILYMDSLQHFDCWL
jgi:hypothetical protein